MKKILKLAVACLGTLGITVAIGMIAPYQCLADETSGRIIKELVKEVDDEMTKLEDRVEDFSNKSDALTQDLKDKHNKLKGSNDVMEQEKIRAEMLLICAELNECDRNEVKSYKGTLRSLIPKLEALHAEINKTGNMGFKHREEFMAFRHKMGNMMSNSVNILKALRKVSVEDNFNQEIAPIENTLVAIYNMFMEPLSSGKNSSGEVRASITNLENTFAQFNCLEKLLNQERLRLKAENYSSLSRLALLRLFKGRLNFGMVNEIPLAKIDGVKARTAIYRDAMKASNGTFEGTNNAVRHTVSTQDKLTMIGKGNPFKHNK